MQSLAALLYLVLLTPAIALKPCAEEVPEHFIAYANSSSSAVDRLVGCRRGIGVVPESEARCTAPIGESQPARRVVGLSATCASDPGPGQTIRNQFAAGHGCVRLVG